MAKLVSVDKLNKLSKELDNRSKERAQNEEIRALAAEKTLSDKIDTVEDMLGGKSLKYVFQAEYDALTEEQKNDPTVTYFITDAEEVESVTNDDLRELEERINAELAKKADVALLTEITGTDIDEIINRLDQ